MNGAQVGLDFQAVESGAKGIGDAADVFRVAGQTMAGVPSATAPQQQATDLLDRVLAGLTRSLQVVETELRDHAGALTATLASYQRAEEVLSNWNVPSWGA
jgi:hypothetical protein